MPIHELYAVNVSSQPVTFIVYLRVVGLRNVVPLAWFSHTSNPQHGAEFYWQENYTLVWGHGKLMQGMQFIPSGGKPADLQGINQATFTTQPSPNFTAAMQGQPDSITILTDNTVPPDVFAVGISIDGAPSMVTQANPNSTTVFSKPVYYLMSAVPEIIPAGTVVNPIAFSNSVMISNRRYTNSFRFDGKEWSYGATKK